MDFLKDIVKEIGDDYTQLAADIDETETTVALLNIKKIKKFKPKTFELIEN